ncbi:MAG TPA: hypothetical protein PKK23_19160 [Nitrospirales bacterium]|nr:hypothetical protein [Nitrospiraceae bacterium]HNP31174.1 hypothetical protein [Nitrospirales bacterium]
MHYDPDVFLEQFSIVKRFVYHLFYYRTLHASYKRHEIQSEFWVHTIDAHLSQAAISWCMVFGSHGCNPTHWKKLSQLNSQEIEKSFRAGLVTHTSLDMRAWEKYWKEMNEFRNEYVAHRHISFQKPVPDFEVALKIAHYYDDWIRSLIAKGHSQEEEQFIPPATFDEPPLRESERFLREEASLMIDQFLKHTKKHQNDESPYSFP